MTQMVSAHSVKKHIENQSTAADALRLSVGNAKAASTASAGRPSISARSDPPMTRLAPSATSTTTSGTDRCRYDNCRRQRHSVHSASGQAGHRNHSHWRPMANRSFTCGVWVRQRHSPRPQAAPAASSTAASTHGAKARTWAWRDRAQTRQPPRPTATAMDGAPLAASSGSATSKAMRARQILNGAAASPYSASVVAKSCASSGVVSWPSCSRPSVAISASRPPSAMARA